MINKKQKKEHKNSPYDILLKEGPDKIDNEILQKTIDKLKKETKKNTRKKSIVDRNFAFINLGLTELNIRSNKKNFIIAIFVSILSLIFAIISLIK